jgi:hypothetical protein
VFNELIPYWQQYPPSHRVACWVAGIKPDSVSANPQAALDAEFARLASLRIHPSVVASVGKVPDEVREIMAKYQDVPMTEGWIRA